MKPLVPTAQARRDIENAIDYYFEAAGRDVAMRFLEAVNDTYESIADRPASGSPRFSHRLDLPGLRSRKLKRFPYLVFYIERMDHIDLVRVLHQQRDIPNWLPEG